MGGSQRVPFQARGVREGQLVDSPPPPLARCTRGCHLSNGGGAWGQ